MNHLNPSILKDKHGLIKTLGIELRELTSERVVATMPITPQHHQPFGYLHGGASVALAETVASVGGLLNCPPGNAAFGLEINANHLRPKREGTLTAIGTPLHIGQTTQVWDVKIFDDDQKLISVSRCTLAVVSVSSNTEEQS
jgi:1,4-dihydroxy-2-naphthoyl-CoA hydrolase